MFRNSGGLKLLDVRFGEERKRREFGNFKISSWINVLRFGFLDLIVEIKVIELYGTLMFE